ncbi:MAG: hypothetical protein LUQ25_09270, partial [Methanoregulaceae archaeon]|nr:hypothetical protein [Methanoregulaceae archaeon]
MASRSHLMTIDRIPVLTGALLVLLAFAAGPVSAAWHTETVDDTGITGYDTSLAFNATGPAVSYVRLSPGTLNFAWKDGDGWHSEPVGSASYGKT